MATSSTELEIVKQLFNTLSDDDKKSFLKSIKNKEKPEKKITFTKEIKECPYCKSTHFKKNGTRNNGKQSFFCLDCKKSFVASNNTILYGVKKDLSVWKKYIHCMIEKYSLRKTAEICGISLPTAFVWRHKILDALQEMQNKVKLNGIVEADETFLPISYKGHHKDFNFPRLAKKRGTSATLRGLSKEQVCISCAINHNGLSISKVSNLGKPKLVNLLNVLANKIAKNSIFVTDSFRAYLKVASDLDLNHIRIPRNKYTCGSFNIQTINNYHSKLKAMIVYNFKGVSTKYLNNYLVYHNFVNFAKENRKDKERILLKHILNNNCISKNINIANRLAVPLLVA
ncbi:IS1595 family transposase [Campylobacter sp. MG1]|uniref:IS1595 family transposase n=1 Tax=Campylobacter sp. MG1 TaxID=2976332 RepID=UPI00226D3350|nr:IS1595 family transposase [Campylobacter sp. MG1]